MLPSLFQLVKPTLQCLSLTATVSNLSPWRQLAEPGNEEIIVRCDGNNQVDRVEEPGTKVEKVDGGVEPAAQKSQKGSAVRWRYAEQGTNMHRIAHLEREDPDFSRKSYIDGVAYMLMALPEDLSNQETATIRRALPPAIMDANIVCPRSKESGWGLIPEDCTMLRWCVARSVAAIVILIYLFLSWVAALVHVATDYEREHRILQRAVSRGVVTAAAVGGRGVVISARVYGMREGRFGQLLNRILAWTVENVTHGIQEGLGEGLTMVDKGLKIG
ncbi:hypothetical protein GGR50DRAFT_693452 [Xylaria sp. CBS 124048]|nr:hypothetical protein GGR50DRAFT_693452 [Xylaria sp. CBS 124048]